MSQTLARVGNAARLWGKRGKRLLLLLRRLLLRLVLRWCAQHMDS